MNRELIKKYKTEFDHWLNGGNTQVYHKKDDEPKWWTDKESINYSGVDNFSYIIDKSLSPDDVLVVIDDTYFTYRKALAEGKTVQYYECVYQNEMCSNLDRYDWLDWKAATPSSSFTKSLNYRIKPEEPKFKVGDWVIHNGKYKRVTKAVDGYIDSLDNQVAVIMKEESLELWEPKPGEWCWFWNFNEMLTLEQFSKYHNLDDHLGNYETLTIKLYQYCEPFIGQLPTYIKDVHE